MEEITGVRGITTITIITIIAEEVLPLPLELPDKLPLQMIVLPEGTTIPLVPPEEIVIVTEIETVTEMVAVVVDTATEEIKTEIITIKIETIAIETLIAAAVVKPKIIVTEDQDPLHHLLTEIRINPHHLHHPLTPPLLLKRTTSLAPLVPLLLPKKMTLLNLPTLILNLPNPPPLLLPLILKTLSMTLPLLRVRITV